MTWLKPLVIQKVKYLGRGILYENYIFVKLQIGGAEPTHKFVVLHKTDMEVSSI